ncbi:hypothetical protein LG311_19630 [Sutcliffiella horikoshii]|uniref:hypothetical protein n=1 Tax=Sutcliffiella horikoshii TaxID=79883 RepID=UPI003850FD4B
MTQLFKGYFSNTVIIVYILLIFLHQLIINRDYFNVTNIAADILPELPEGFIYTFYMNFFELLKTPLVQGILFSLLFIIFIYIINLVFFGLAKFTKIKVRFLKVTEAVVISFSVIIIKKIFEITYTLVSGEIFQNDFVDFAFSLLQITVYCFFIRFLVVSEKVNMIIYIGLIFFITILYNSFFVAHYFI